MSVRDNSESLDENYEKLYFAICEKAVEDYKKNLKILEKSKSEDAILTAKADNDNIRRFLGKYITGEIERKYYEDKTIVKYTKGKRKHPPKGLTGAEWQHAYYELNKEVIAKELRERRNERIRLGICTKCGRNKAVEGRRWCKNCIDKGR
jgi:hypothetical protein